MAPSRGLQCLTTPTCSRSPCRKLQLRGFATSSSVRSGHNRWSKIKHDKAKVDAGKNRQRSIFAQEIATASRLFGGDPNMNPRLADLITKAKREGFLKTSIEAAIARGQGRSMSGASLESVTVEAILPNNVAAIVECETDNKLRTLAEVRLAVKENGGTSTPTSYLFTKKGKIMFERKEGVDFDEVLESALEAGATDVTEDEERRIIVWAEPGETRAVGNHVAEALDLNIATSEIIWDPNKETTVELPGRAAAAELVCFIDELQEKEQAVQAVAMNITQGSLPGDTWKDLQSRLGAL